MSPAVLIVGAFAMSFGLAFGCVLVFKYLRKRDERNSPLKNRHVDAGYVPGQGLVERVGDHQDDLLLSFVIMYFAFPMMLLAWALARVPPRRVVFDGAGWLYIAMGLLLFGFGLQRFIKHWNARRKALDGLLAERVTGMQLNRLQARGCIVMHDLPCELGNIDHVVIAPRGVFAVETKSFRKPRQANAGENYVVSFDGTALTFPDFIENDAPAQALKQAQWLAKTLKQVVKRDVRVIAALALPGWKVDNLGDVWRTAPVKVFSPLGEGANFMALDYAGLDSETRLLVKEALAMRYPQVSD